jgi:hypothetical protein
MARVSCLWAALLGLALCWQSAALAGGDDEKIVGIWERLHEKEKGTDKDKDKGKDKDNKDYIEETWIIKKVKDKWTVSGNFYKDGKEIGNFKGKDVKFADATLTFTQDFFKLPRGKQSGALVTVSAEGDRLDVSYKPKKGEETKDNMERAGDYSEVLGSWKIFWGMYKEVWTFEKDKSGTLIVRGTINQRKDKKELGNWKAVNVRYFNRTVIFNQQFEKLPTRTWANGTAIACAGRGGQLVYIWQGPTGKGKNKMTREKNNQ